MATILSTKILTKPQKELLLNAGIGLVHYDGIKVIINPQGIEVLKGLRNYDNVIFTSKNAVKAIQTSNLKIQNCFCVGLKTKKLLEENEQNVVRAAQNAQNLAKIILKKHKKEQFLFLCGNLRRDELPVILKENGVELKELTVYKTEYNWRKFNREFDGVLFFSPSAVHSYIAENDLKNSIAFCIGETTASEIKKHTDAIIVANNPTIENVIVQVVKYFKKNT